MAEPRTALTADALSARLQQAAVDTPYTVTPTADGVALQLALDDERWLPLFQRYGVRRTFRIDADVRQPAGTVATTIQLFGLTWQPGGQPGRFVPVVDPNGTVLDKEFDREGKVVEFEGAAPDAIHSFTAIEASGWLWRQVTAAGLRRRKTTAQKAETVIALVVAAIGVLGAVAAVIALLVTSA